MHGKKECVLVKLGSQDRWMEKAVRSNFLDYLFVSCDNDLSEEIDVAN